LQWLEVIKKMKQIRKTDGGIASILIVVLLLAVTVGLYLQIVLFDQPSSSPSVGLVPQASVQVLEGDEVPTLPAGEPLPADQMQVIIQVFAPETVAN
jgi:hypothetical protein